MRDPKGVLSDFGRQSSRVSGFRPSRRTLLGAAAGLFAAAGSGTRSWGADAFPSQPIKILVPYTPGASSDTLMRLVGAKLSESVNQPVIIENRPGGGGAVAAMAVKEATPDGYTLLMGHSGIYAFIPVLFPKEMRYDPINDFAPITPLISFSDDIGGAGRRPGQVGQGTHRACPFEAQRSYLRVARRRQHRASDRRDVQGAREHSARPCAVSWRRSRRSPISWPTGST